MHAPCTHAPPTHDADALAKKQRLPQVAQLLTSTLVLTSQPLPGSESQFAKPGLQSPMTQLLPEHEAAAFAKAHPCPHMPQLAVLEVRSVSQPLVVLLSQSPRPAAQLESVQTPAEHEAPPPMNEHTFPHEAQLFTLVCVLVSQPSAAPL